MPIRTDRPRLYCGPNDLARLKALVVAGDPRAQALRNGAGNDLTSDRPSLPNLAVYQRVQAANDPRFAAKAVQRCLSLASMGLTPVSIDQGFGARDVLPAVAMVYDWLHDLMTDGDRSIIRAALERWADWVWPETNPARANAWGINDPGNNYHSGFMMTWLVGIALSGDSPKAQGYLDNALNRWNTVVRPYLETKAAGGYLAEGTNYGSGTLYRMLSYVTAHQIATGETLDLSWLWSAFLTLFASTSPDCKHDAPFGDQTAAQGALLDNYDRLCGLVGMQIPAWADELRFWLDGIKPNPVSNLAFAWGEFLFYRKDVPVTDYRGQLGLSRYCPGTGFLTARSSWEPNALQLHYRCGRVLNSHEDTGGQGEFALIHGGDWMLGGAHLWSDTGLQQGAMWNNCLTIDDRGQTPYQDAASSPQVLSTEDNDVWTTCTSGLSRAYDYTQNGIRRQPFTSYLRQWAFLKATKTFLLCDRFTKANPASVVKLHLNMKTQPAADFHDAGKAFLVTYGSSQMQVSLLTAPSPGWPIVSPVNLGPGSAISSYRTEIAGDNVFLLVFQCGPAGFTPLPVTETPSGVRVGDDEVIFDGGSIRYVDHRISPRDKALSDLYESADAWWDAYTANPAGHDAEAQAVFAAARAALQYAPVPGEEK